VGVTPDGRELLGAYALDALDDDEAAIVESLLEHDAEAAAELRRLRQAAAWIAATEALTPPHDLRSQLFERAQPVPVELRVYRQAVARHERLVESLPADGLDIATANGLSVGDLVVHLAAMESAVAETIGHEESLTGESDVEARTARYLAEFGSDPLGAGRRSWQDAVAALDGWAVAGGDRAGLPWNGFVVGRRTALVTRAFELWTHDDDIRVALGREREVPTAPELGLMSDIAVAILPFCLATTGGPADGVARVVLTGEGGGTWDVSLDGGGPRDPAVTVTMDVVDYCRRVADRIAVEDCDARIEGDVELGARLLACAPALATL
jgi:uncharacterized protein (TIGR03083 family)